jgi:hypothetical protein
MTLSQKRAVKRKRTGMEEKWEVVRHLKRVIRAPKIPENLRIGLQLAVDWILDERTRRIK